MYQIGKYKREDYSPEHIIPSPSRQRNLKRQIDAHRLTEMWDMILTLDYNVSDVSDLSPEDREDFEKVMSLLLQAFSAR